MKTLSDYTLLYDAECPACATYTQLFVKTRMIAREVRQPYDKMLHVLKVNIDWVRASNEIALVNHKTGEVHYGIDSLFKIIASSFPVFAPLFALKPFRWLMAKLYFFISYNRKVIVPGKQSEECSVCAPTLNYPYRVMYLFVTWLFTSWVLMQFSHLLPPLVPASHVGREFLICGGQLLFQGILVWGIGKRQLIYYLGHLMTVSLMGALLLLPVLWVGQSIVPPHLALLYFLLVVGIMLLEHIRRINIIGLPWCVSATWVLYRLLILLLIL